MNLQPLHDRVLIRPAKPQEVTSGGIIIPDSAKEKPSQGEVLETGTGRITTDGTVIPIQVSVGQTILYSKYSGTTVSINGEDLILLNESDILGIILS
jgi:chaperonin GroES